MLETIFKMRIKKWEDSIAILDANTDNLRSDEQEAISALKNLWRAVAFGPSCTQRVERLVKVLSDADKLHGNNRDIIQASKDFRGVAKEMYTIDAETLEQFKNAMQQAMGGPRRSPQQQRQHEQQWQQQRSRSGQQRPQVAQPRSRQQPQSAQPTPGFCWISMDVAFPDGARRQNHPSPSICTRKRQTARAYRISGLCSAR
jgi:multidrug resistance efflux pump